MVGASASLVEDFCGLRRIGTTRPIHSRLGWNYRAISESFAPPVATPAPPNAFVTTRWSRVIRAGAAERDEAQEALASLCQDYWRPLFQFARRAGRSVEEAQDLTQGFLCELIESNTFARADRTRGRFRSFLLAAFVHFMANEQRQQNAQKRGGGQIRLSIEEEIGAEPPNLVDHATPELHYERSWAYTLLARVLAKLQHDYEAVGRGALFQTLHPHLSGGGGHPSHADLGAALKMTEGAISTALHRMRRRYGELLRAEIAETVESEGEVEEELRHLLRVIAG